MTLQLKPCAHCGGAASLYDTVTEIKLFWVECTACHVRTREYAAMDRTAAQAKEMAIADWERREAAQP